MGRVEYLHPGSLGTNSDRDWGILGAQKRPTSESCDICKPCSRVGGKESPLTEASCPQRTADLIFNIISKIKTCT